MVNSHKYLTSGFFLMDYVNTTIYAQKNLILNRH